MAVVSRITTQDVRFPTSLALDGSDAVNVDPDYSAAYVTLSVADGSEGHAFVFTCGRGNEIVTHAIDVYADLLVGRDVDELTSDLGAAAARLIHDSQLRWLGPEKGVTQMACGALINALWDLRARAEDVPLWLLLSHMSADELVSTVDFTHIRDVLSPSTCFDILRVAQQGKDGRIAQLRSEGYPAYTTTPGWLGYSDEKLVRLARAAAVTGFPMIKLKVGRDVEEDRRRLALVNREVPQVRVAVDANQRWEVSQAVEWVRELADFEPYWVEEPTSTDDVLGHAAVRRQIAPIRVATGEAVHNRIMFKQFLQAQAIDVLQLDATRVGGINENLATLLLAAEFDVPVCPHAGGVGLCEVVQHLSFFDYAAVSASQQGRFLEYVDHLHEHFAEPARIVEGRYVAPSLPGSGAEMRAQSRRHWAFPSGPGWVTAGRSQESALL